ncbi:restriction endonuclease subunit M [bacterium]|nr:MAG: restriction endonuclease subunit M [bacterium]
MSLFQKIIVKKYLNKLSSELIEKYYQKYSVHFLDPAMAERVKALKEEQYQEGFLRDLFVKCLGYTINPYKDFDLTTEFKNKTDAEKADGAILKAGKPIAVIELKSTKIKDLKTIEKQAFNYKAHQSNCKYVITSNFDKIRLYINDATEFEEFNVFELSENEFKLLYLCFSKESIFDDIPAIIKEKSNIHEEQISKKLYNDYSVFRNKIFQNLTKNNPQIDKLLLFKKAQKLLDRFLFIFFAEDKGLIPPNLISKIIDDYRKLKDLDVYSPLYKIFVRYFGYIDKGNEKFNIGAYNGGLFEFDEILDNVKIDDEILIEDSLTLSNYDFDSEIDVNILGHIFEHSLTDIEKLNAEISGENLDKKQTRRKKEGVFYTPNYITKYIVENTIGTLCSEKRNELQLNNLEVDETYFKKGRKAITTPSQKGEQLFDKLEKYKKWLLSLKILDPACGSGAFLNQALNFLIDEHNFIIDIETDLRMGQLVAFDIDTAVLENNLYGVDINEESVEIAQLSLWLKTATKGRKLTDLSKNIKCGNSLIDDPEIAGDKAFDWNIEFPEIMQNGGFDVVIGNPPYVQLSKIKHTSESEKSYLKIKYKTSGGRFNTFIFFIHLGTEILKKNGFLSFIIPNTILTQEYYRETRFFIVNNSSIKQIITYPFLPFEDATVENITFIIRKEIVSSKIQIIEHTKDKIDTTKEIESKKILNTYNYVIDIRGDLICSKIEKLQLNHLQDFVEINQAIALKCDKLLSVKSEYKDEYFKLIDGKHINKYLIKWGGDYLDYDIERIHSCKRTDIFESKEKLFFRRVSGHLVFAYDDKQYFALNTLVVVNLKKNSTVSIKYLLAILNSKLLNHYYINKYKSTKKVFSEIQARTVKLMPIPEISIKNQKPFIDNADIMLSLNKQKQEKIIKFLHRLETSFEIEKLSNKMKTFYDYDFKMLITELKKIKIKLTLSQQDEWEEYFNKHKEEINKLQNQINKTDKEIDQMVYELYGLTDEEIGIVENE